MANSDSHAKLISGLAELGGDISPEELIIIDDGMNKGTELQMDAEEMIAALDEYIATHQGDKGAPGKNLETEKLEREIEKLKVETEYARSRIEKSKVADTKTK